jgi:selenocysteine lyase/cysteine desulfurase
MKYNAEQITFMLAEAIDQNREYKSWHCSTQHLMALVERVVAEEREACAQMLEAASKTGKIISCTSAAEAIRARGQA